MTTTTTTTTNSEHAECAARTVHMRRPLIGMTWCGLSEWASPRPVFASTPRRATCEACRAVIARVMRGASDRARREREARRRARLTASTSERPLR